jgi:hypothetical protein
MGMKEFTKEWKPKKMDKDERVRVLSDSIPGIVTYYIKKGHRDQDAVNELFDKMEDEKLAKTLLKVLKEDDAENIDLGLATVVADFLERRHDKIGEEIVTMYDDAINKILKKRIKKVSKKLDLEKDIVKELLVIVPDKEAISDERFVGIYSQKITRKLYALAKDIDLGLDETKQVKKLFKELFDENLIEAIAANILLERKENIKNFNDKQTAVWNLMTSFALETIEALKKKDIRELLEYYIGRRQKDAEKGRDFARRVQLSQVSEDYEKILSVVEDMSEKEKFKKFL